MYDVIVYFKQFGATVVSVNFIYLLSFRRTKITLYNICMEVKSEIYQFDTLILNFIQNIYKYKYNVPFITK